VKSIGVSEDSLGVAGREENFLTCVVQNGELGPVTGCRTMARVPLHVRDLAARCRRLGRTVETDEGARLMVHFLERF
jgi:hypothetical protein